MTKRPSAAECVATTLRRRCHDAATPCWNVVRCSACNILHCATYIIRACVDACERARVFDRVRAAHEGVRMAPLANTGVRMLCRCESGEPSPGADVGGSEPSSGADVVGMSPVLVQMWQDRQRIALLAQAEVVDAPEEECDAIDHHEPHLQTRANQATRFGNKGTRFSDKHVRVRVSALMVHSFGDKGTR